MPALLDAGAAGCYVERLSGGGGVNSGHAGRAAAALRALTGQPGAAGVKEVVRAGALPPLLMLMGAGDSPAALEKFMKDYTERSGKEVEALKPYEEAKRYRF